MSEETTSLEPIEPYAIQSWTQSIIRPILIILLVAAMMGAIFSVLILLGSSRVWLLGFVVCFFVILESYLTTYWLYQPARRNLHQLKYRTAEILVLIVIIRLLTWSIEGMWPTTQVLLAYLKSPDLLLDDGTFWVLLFLCLVAWQRTIAISRIFFYMEPDEAEIAYYNLPRNERDQGNKPISDDRSYLLNIFSQQFMIGGLIILFCAGISSFNLPELTNVEEVLTQGLSRLSLSSGMLISLITYFLCGFMLLSQGKLAILEMRWLANDVKQRTPIGRYWYRRTLFVLLAIGLIAAFLPIGSTFPFMQLLNAIINGVITVIMIVIYLITLLLYYLFALLFPEGTSIEDSPAPPPPPQPLQTPPIETSETIQYIFSSAFWAVTIIMSIIAFSFFLRDRGVKIDNAFLQRIWLTIKLWWQLIRHGINEQLQEIQGGVQAIFAQKPRTGTKEQPPWRFIRLNALSPRERVYYFYLSTVKRANEKGVPREISETPLEFADDLKENWPDAEQEIDELTDAFLQARYSPETVEEDDVTPIKKQWKRLKSNLRKRK